MKKIKLLYLTLLIWISVSNIAWASAAIDEIVKKGSGDKLSNLVDKELSFSGTTIWVLIATLFICLNLTHLAFEVAQHFGGASSGPVGNSIYSSVSAVAGGVTVAAGRSITKGYGLYKQSKRASENKASSSKSSKSAGTNSYEGPEAAATTPVGQSNNSSATGQPTGQSNNSSTSTTGQTAPTPTNPSVKQPTPQPDPSQIRRHTASDSTGTNVTMKSFSGDLDTPPAPARPSAATGIALVALAFGKKAIRGAEKALGGVAKIISRSSKPTVDKNGVYKDPANERNIRKIDAGETQKETKPNKRKDRDLDAARKIGGRNIHSLEGAYSHTPEGREEGSLFSRMFRKDKS